ncbi:MAG: hypothetical protein ACPGMR_03270 [Pontibacterium sp.]
MSDTNITIEAINAAEDNDALIELAKELFPDFELSKRRNVETNRKVLLDEVKLQEQQEAAGEVENNTIITKTDDGGIKVKPRLLKNKETGATFVYTEALAKLGHMVEVD